MKKQRKSKASARKKKRQRARNKREREKGRVIKKPNYSEGSADEPQVKKDSLHYSFASNAEDQYIIIKFNKIDPDKKDSVLIKYPDKGDEISNYDKQVLKNYVDSNKIEKIALINIREHIGTKEEDRYKNKHTSPVKRNLTNYFILLGIPPQKIICK